MLRNSLTSFSAKTSEFIAVDLLEPKPPNADACEVGAPNDGALNENVGAAAPVDGAPNPPPPNVDVPKPLNADCAKIFTNIYHCALF